MTAEYCSEQCTIRQLSTLFKMQTLSITKDTYQFCTLACSFEREIEKGKGEQGSRKKDKFKKQFIPFIFRVQTTFWYKNGQTTNLGTK